MSQRLFEKDLQPCQVRPHIYRMYREGSRWIKKLLDWKTLATRSDWVTYDHLSNELSGLIVTRKLRCLS